jgi:hypothetical protein
MTRHLANDNYNTFLATVPFPIDLSVIGPFSLAFSLVGFLPMPSATTESGD